VSGQADRLLQAYGGLNAALPPLAGPGEEVRVEGDAGSSPPFSPEHESEADRSSVMMVARAGYDPNEAPRLWQRLAKRAPDDAPGFRETHPSSVRRETLLMSLMGEAAQLYALAQRQHGRGQSIIAG
jgi:predicted Zn-dependent protease